MAVFDMLRGQLTQVALRIPPVVKAKVSLDRLTAFFQKVRACLLSVGTDRS
jgi:hypothetical protein